jgi:hypothetical protein
MTNKSKSKTLVVVSKDQDEQQQLIATTPMALLQLAITSNADMDKLKQLMDMQKEWNAQKAKEEFFNALSGFQNDCPEIKKVRKVNYQNKTGGNTKYNYASLGDIEKQIKGAMMKHGLSKRFELREENKQIILTCKVTHKLGHTESTTISGEMDASGGKNDIHAKGSTISYLERYALLAALGISTADTDDDGQAAGKNDGNDLPFLTEEGYANTLKLVMAGKLTIEDLEKQRSLKPEQRKALEVAEKNFKEKKV